MIERDDSNDIGRPNSICAQVSGLASRGLTVDQVANCLAVSGSAAYDYQGKYVER